VFPRHLIIENGALVTKCCEVIVVGAGPAGIVAAIAARKRGLQATVLDGQLPPIDKPCGEGILPQGVAALRALDISLPRECAFSFKGIRFVDGEHSVRADFAGATGVSMRRVKLHQLLMDRAVDAGVEFRWGERVTKLDDEAVTTTKETYSYRWLVGADGRNSQVGKWAELNPPTIGRNRFGFCSHLQVQAWPAMAEVYWERGCQIFVTPMAGQEVCVAVLSGDPGLRLKVALPRFPELAVKLRGAVSTSREAGNTTSLRILSAVTRGRVALIGDASGSVDAVTGHGLSLSFQQAIPLAEAMSRGDLTHYQDAHRKIAAVPILMTRLMLLMSENSWIRHRTIQLFQKSPALFSRLLAIHTESAPLSSVGVAEIAGLGWKFLRT
jgi:flavin-dependent dehydrogenase